MPTIAIIDGVKINIYSHEHPPPHFHAIYAEYEAMIRISDLEIEEGKLPSKTYKKVKKWAESSKEKIELFYLPAYCPDLNPDEYLNCDLKQNVHGKNVAKNQENLEDNTRRFMRSLQRNPKRIKSYFKHKKITYAA